MSKQDAFRVQIGHHPVDYDGIVIDWDDREASAIARVKARRRLHVVTKGCAWTGCTHAPQHGKPYCEKHYTLIRLITSDPVAAAVDQ